MIAVLEGRVQAPSMFCAHGKCSTELSHPGRFHVCADLTRSGRTWEKLFLPCILVLTPNPQLCRMASRAHSSGPVLSWRYILALVYSCFSLFPSSPLVSPSFVLFRSLCPFPPFVFIYTISEVSSLWAYRCCDRRSIRRESVDHVQSSTK